MAASPEAVALVRQLLEACAVTDDDLFEALREAAAERRWDQTRMFGIKELESAAERRIIRWIGLGRAIEGIYNYVTHGKGRGIKMLNVPGRNEVVKALCERVYEIADEEQAKKNWTEEDGFASE